MTQLYLVSPPKIELDAFAGALQQALSASDIVKSFQLRLKDASDEEVLAAAKILLPICHAKQVAFILNDRPDLAVQCDADGVHLGQEDMGVKEARAIMGDDRVIGVSCHASKHMAMDAAEQGADYVAFGAFFPTQSKPKEKVEKWGVPTSDIIKDWTEFTVIPCVAIGGITPENCKPLVEAGADFIAAITSVWGHSQGPAVAIKEFADRISQ